MGIFDFIKKKDPLDDFKLPEQDFTSSDPFAQSSNSFNDQSSFDMKQPFQESFQQPVQPQSHQNFGSSFGQGFSQQEFPKQHETELILSKLDILKSMIENVSHRMSVLEQKIDMENERRKRSW